MDRPEVEEHKDIRFLSMEEVEALLAAVSDDHLLGATDRALHLTATMTGLRQGECHCAGATSTGRRHGSG